MRLKNVLGGLLIVTMLVGAPVNAHAASASASYRLGNGTFHAVCVIGENSATAVSSFGTVAGMTAYVKYSYLYGENHDNYKQVTAENGNAATSVSATAKALPEHKMVDSIRADARHFITYRGATKTLNTSVKAS